MMKLVVLYNPPADPEAFDKHYFDVHMPLAEKLPGLVKAEVGKVAGGNPYYVVTELWFESMDAFGAAMGSDIGKEVAADVANFGQAGSDTLLVEIR